jgi:hypothetical protein
MGIGLNAPHHIKALPSAKGRFIASSR